MAVNYDDHYAPLDLEGWQITSSETKITPSPTTFLGTRKRMPKRKSIPLYPFNKKSFILQVFP